MNRLRFSDVVRLLAVVLICAALLFGAAFYLPEEQVIVDSGVRILRAMTSNPGTCMAVNGEYFDWLELVNLSDEPVDMTGWKLTDQLDVRTGYVFPEMTLSPGESAVVYAAARPEDAPADALFCDFPLSADGVSLTLLDSRDQYCDILDIPAISAGSVYALDAQSGVYTERSPYDPLGCGLDLSRELAPAFNGQGVVINELMASNGSTLKDDIGAYSDWIELYNGSASAVDLTGWSMSDDSMNRTKWMLPGTTLGAGEYMTVFAVGEEAEGLRASFKLSSEGERVILYDAGGTAVSYMEYDALDVDQALVRSRDGGVEKSFLPSPGYENTAEGARNAIDAEYTTPAANEMQLYINEVMCSVEGMEDWLELYNASAQAIDLSGFGISDNPNRPRKWQFPEGASIPAGGYLAIKLVGAEGESGLVNGVYQVDFALSVGGDELLLLATDEGEVIDRMLLTGQRRGVSYGRAAGAEEYRFFKTPTPNAANSGSGYVYCATEVQFSVQGGVQSGPVELALSAQEGMTIFYTTDGTNPTGKSTVYTGPMTISKNTVVKAVAWREGAIESEVCGHTYVFGAKHTGYVVMVSGKRSQLNGSSGTLNTGAAGNGYDVYAEIYDVNGSRLVAQECYLHLNGRSTRTQFAQKAFRLVAKKEYGDNRFKAALFSERDYEEYKAIIVRCAGQDNQGAFMRDPLLTALARNTSVMYQEHEPAVVYVNGQYWGAYYLRERVTPESICQFEGWTNPDKVDLLEGRGAVVQGSNDSYYDMMSFVRHANLRNDADLEKLRRYMDVENYLEYVMLEMYSGNQDLNNQRMYRSTEGDGKWRWILFDLDLGFRSDNNIVRQWASGNGQVGSITWQDNTLFYELMKNGAARDYFLTRFGELLATDMSTESVLADIQELYSALEPEMDRHCDRWDWSVNTWMSNGKKLINYAQARPKQLIIWLIDEFDLSNDQAKHYFGAAAEKING